MSRLQVVALDDRYEVFVGWDTPLCTFFAQVFDLSIAEAETADEEADPVVL
ncbi:MAG: hypothetical protein KME13_17300 [Myxacorys californica WJT36-NPBG1]|jgi:hypothetical protein|nr:hypothetical protein [Myxacorys californica WJT36-NPBG1]